MVALSETEWKSIYPMDFYANDSLGVWTVNNEKHRPKRTNVKSSCKGIRNPEQDKT